MEPLSQTPLTFQHRPSWQGVRWNWETGLVCSHAADTVSVHVCEPEYSLCTCQTIWTAGEAQTHWQHDVHCPGSPGSFSPTLIPTTTRPKVCGRLKLTPVCDYWTFVPKASALICCYNSSHSSGKGFEVQHLCWVIRAGSRSFQFIPKVLDGPVKFFHTKLGKVFLCGSGFVRGAVVMLKQDLPQTVAKLEADYCLKYAAILSR